MADEPSQFRPPHELSAADTDALLTFVQSSESARKLGKDANELTPAFDRANATRPNLLKSLNDAGRRTGAHPPLLVSESGVD
jgi:hypothetical protein